MLGHQKRWLLRGAGAVLCRKRDPVADLKERVFPSIRIAGGLIRPTRRLVSLWDEEQRRPVVRRL